MKSVGIKSTKMNKYKHRIHNVFGMKLRAHLCLYNPSESSTTALLLSYISICIGKNSTHPFKTFESPWALSSFFAKISLTSAVFALVISDIEGKVAGKPLCLSRLQTLLSSLCPISVLHFGGQSLLLTFLEHFLFLLALTISDLIFRFQEQCLPAYPKSAHWSRRRSTTPIRSCHPRGKPRRRKSGACFLLLLSGG